VARQRFIWPDLWEDPDIGLLSAMERLLFVALFSNADDAGRIAADPANLRATAFRFDDVTLREVETMRDHVVATLRHVELYTVAGRPYIQLTSWDKRQHPKYPQPSRLPGPEQADPAPTAPPTEPTPPAPPPCEPSATTEPATAPLTVSIAPWVEAIADRTGSSVTVLNAKDIITDGTLPEDYGPGSPVTILNNGDLAIPGTLPEDCGNVPEVLENHSSVGWVGLGREEIRDPEILATPAAPSVATAPYQAEFDHWWAGYPVKVRKQRAFRQYQARRRAGLSAADLLAARDHYLAQPSTRPGFIRYPANFLDRDVGEWVHGPPTGPPADTGPPESPAWAILRQDWAAHHHDAPEQEAAP